MSVRYAILGLLSEQPMHGYRLKKIVDQRLSPLWGLTTGQIYQSLAAMERTALVESRIERRGHRPRRRVYAVTPAGKRHLATWLDRPPAHVSRAFRQEAIIRMMFLDAASAPEFERWLGRESDEIGSLLGRVRQMRNDGPPKGRRNLAAIYLTSLQHRLESDLKNLQVIRAELAR